MLLLLLLLLVLLLLAVFSDCVVADSSKRHWTGVVRRAGERGGQKNDESGAAIETSPQIVRFYMHLRGSARRNATP